MDVFILQGASERQRGIHYEMSANAQPIGEGGMGKVYQGVCVDERTGATRPVAIKFLYEDLPPQAYERARREASIQLRNDNLIEMLGFVETQWPDTLGVMKTHYQVVSELLDGVSLDDVLEGKVKDREGQDMPYAVKLLTDFRNDPEHFARTVVMNVLSGLMALHDAGYVHRDIDPSNIFITSNGHIKLIDFGIAKQMNQITSGDKALTVAGKFMGKPEYAAPELAMGDVAHQNQTTDIYAMGILLYQCIIGHTPFQGPRHEILEKQMHEKLPLNIIRNKELRAIIAKACEKKQELRYPSATQMRAALEMVGAGHGSANKNRTLLMAVAAIAIVLVVVAGIAVAVLGGNDDSAKVAGPVPTQTALAPLDCKTLADGLRLTQDGFMGLTLQMNADQTARAVASFDETISADAARFADITEINGRWTGTGSATTVVVSASFDDPMATTGSTGFNNITPIQLGMQIPLKGELADKADELAGYIKERVRSFGPTAKENARAIIVNVGDHTFFVAQTATDIYVNCGYFEVDDINLDDF